MPRLILYANRANVTGNVIDFAQDTAMSVNGVELVVSANLVQPGRLQVTGAQVIVTSNLCAGILAMASPGPVIRVGNFPSP